MTLLNTSHLLPSNQTAETKKHNKKYRINCGIFVYLWSGRQRVNLPSGKRRQIVTNAPQPTQRVVRGKDSNPTKGFCRSNPHVPNRKLKPPQMRRFEFSGRGERIRTFDTLVPNQVLYQTELRPETKSIITAFFLIANLFLYLYDFVIFSIIHMK